ncbi:MAG TPA: phosphatidylserine/phosphatidylglycerophosphate/cardiolipin synthase family protein [Thermoanaerobaculales bacterium]|nr:phosphatidylserine/phosphatidylglycerophosphate/cardiolipin synthase family protein [Thermoanaerobaculales bacterium]HQN96668.1 phosphatidylserine/phosphatidylglycerophosphate/cardiolipin synthase family protein [Thermoanaerobaculales bacterium]HQP43529.1 phosphatidylserine/phosphatidylglycerophosphate/cardiolipin synthase family protein [Thermoanaerobaculales bacterium]
MRSRGFRQPRRLAAAAWLAGMAVIAPVSSISAGDEDPVTRLGRTRWTHGNSARLLVYPEESWQARLELVARARHHVFISTFSWHRDHYGDRFREHLVELVRARRRENPDFTVFCLVDAIARGNFDRSFRELEEAGAVVRSFNRQSWGVGPLYDPRMHDKMIVADGRWAIVGGRNFADEYFEPERWWLDLEVLLEGEAVWDLQLNFLKAWQVADLFGNANRFFMPEETARRRISVLWQTGRLPNGRSPLDRFMNAEFFPPVAGKPGERSVAVLYDSPLVRPRAATTDLVIELIRQARAEVDVMTPFPNFTRELTEALIAARARGTRVRVFVNGEAAALRRGPFLWAGLPTVMELVGNGVDVWAWSGNGQVQKILTETACEPREVPPVALHGKLLRVDDVLTIVHSSNFNIRSTYYNTEAGVVVRDAAFNAEVETLLDGLTSLRDLQLDCGDRIDEVAVGQVIEKLGPDDLPRLREVLGNRQGWVDALGLMW